MPRSRQRACTVNQRGHDGRALRGGDGASGQGRPARDAGVALGAGCDDDRLVSVGCAVPAGFGSGVGRGGGGFVRGEVNTVLTRWVLQRTSQ